jgi:Recombination endonuclease VII
MPFKDPKDRKRWMDGRKKRHAEEMREWRAAHREEYNAKHKAWSDQNRDRLREYDRQWRQNNLEHAREMDRARYKRDRSKRLAAHKAYYATPKIKQMYGSQSLARSYGLTSDEFSALLIASCGKCAICSSQFLRNRKEPHVDHAHDSKEVRGLLCINCNNGLGRFRDSADLLDLAAAYLRKG